jgi:hypothetical protein
MADPSLKSSSHQTRSVALQNKQSMVYKRNQRVSKGAFKELFRYEENDRFRRQLKRDYREIEEGKKHGVKFKHLIGKTPIYTTLATFNL